MKKSLGPSHVFSCAKEIIDIALPIQCVEATFIGLYLTRKLDEFHRFPLSFKSYFEDGPHRHMVLVLKSKVNGLWGAIGISRRQDLMYKPLIFTSLYDLIIEYKRSYENNYHRLSKVYFGSNNINIYSGSLDRVEKRVEWKELKIKIPKILLPTVDLIDLETQIKMNNININTNIAMYHDYINSRSVKERCDLFSEYISL